MQTYKRQSGVLMPIFSLPSKYGIGDFGKESYNFIDVLYKSGQKVWQILPLVQTGYGNSPYSSVCSTSFNPYFISIEKLKEMGLITASELKSSLCNQKYIDYGFLYNVRFPLLIKAFNRFDKTSPEFVRYIKSKESIPKTTYITKSFILRFFIYFLSYKNTFFNLILSFSSIPLLNSGPFVSHKKITLFPVRLLHTIQPNLLDYLRYQ